jgi:hypothetical protein
MDKHLVPEGEREALMRATHDLGHFGPQKMFQQLRDQGKWWPGMLRESDQVQRHRWKKIRLMYLQRHLLYNGLFHLRQLRENSTSDSFN